MKLKKLIKSIRPKITITSLAECIGMSRSRFNLYVNSGIDIRNMNAVNYIKLCDILKVDYKYFL